MDGHAPLQLGHRGNAQLAGLNISRTKVLAELGPFAGPSPPYRDVQIRLPSKTRRLRECQGCSRAVDLVVG